MMGWREGEMVGWVWWDVCMYIARSHIRDACGCHIAICIIAPSYALVGW